MEVDLRDYARIFSKRRWLIAGTLIVCLGLTALWTLRMKPRYESHATLFVGQRQISVGTVRQGIGVTNLSARLLQSYAQIIQSRSIVTTAVRENGLPLNTDAIVRNLSADAIAQTQILELRYRGNNPGLAQRIVDAVAGTFVEEIERIETTGGGEDAEPAIQVSVIDPANRPTRPVAPNPVRNMVLAFGFAIFLGAGLAIVRERLDVTVKNRREIEEELELPVLHSIPKLDTHGTTVYLENDPQAVGAEAFRKVRTAVQFLGVDDPVRTILVTSPSAAEGKTTVALNLAATYAQAGMRTVLVEADLRRPSLHQLFPLEGTAGLTTAVIGRVPLERAIVQTGVRNLACIPAGAIPPNPVELLLSEHMHGVLQALANRFDIIVIDSPPLLPVADASSLAPQADGVIIVARSGETHRERLRDAAKLVESSRGRILGVVLNALTRDTGGYEYGYYYGQDTRAAVATTDTAWPDATKAQETADVGSDGDGERSA